MFSFPLSVVCSPSKVGLVTFHVVSTRLMIHMVKIGRQVKTQPLGIKCGRCGRDGSFFKGGDVWYMVGCMSEAPFNHGIRPTHII